MNPETIALIHATIAKIKPHACEEQFVPALAALERGDYEHVLAIARGNIEWITDLLGYTPAELLDGEAIMYCGGNIRLSGNLRNGQRQGVWRWWYPNGALASESHYENGKRQGLWREWYPNGVLAAEGGYENDQRHGLWCEWHPDGTLASEEWYLNDTPISSSK